jgi:prevent-host-death family protein
MKTATISQTKNQLSALLDLVRHGETIVITERDRPVARLEPIESSDPSTADGRLLRLERAGIVCRGEGGVVSDLLAPPPRPLRGGDILQALLEERDESP